jgi:hypothetical protein
MTQLKSISLWLLISFNTLIVALAVSNIRSGTGVRNLSDSLYSLLQGLLLIFVYFLISFIINTFILFFITELLLLVLRLRHAKFTIV